MGCGASNNSTVSTSRNDRVPIPTSQPLARSKNYRNGSPITSLELGNQRNEFWSTRTDGNLIMWQAIRSSALALLDNDVALANAILNASNIISPNGSLEATYDERGHQYKVPSYCFSNPIELINIESPDTLTNLQANGNNISLFTTIEPRPTNVNGIAFSKVRNSSKTTVTIAEAIPIQVKIRINPGDYNLLVKAKTSNSILDLKHSILQESLQSAVSLPLFEEERQRIVFLGRELQNAQLLGEIGFDETKVVQVFLRPSKKPLAPPSAF